MGIELIEDDEGVHVPGDAINWNESRYVDFWDPAAQVGGWMRIGNRPNAQYAEMSACVYLPDGSVAFRFDRAAITENGLCAGGQSWEIVDPFRINRVRFDGEMSVFSDGWILKNPKHAFTTSPRLDASVDLTCHSTGLATVLGHDQDHIERIFLPGQTDFHYQHLARVTGTIHLGDQTFTVDGRGGKDHSWGPRNWHAKIYLRWLIAAIDDDNGFMLTRAVGPTKQTRSGFVLRDGQFTMVDDFVMTNSYAGSPNHELVAAKVSMRAQDHEIGAVATLRNALPARHRQANEAGEEAILRIVKYPAEWRFDDGRVASGHCEYHDQMIDDVPVALHD